MSVAVNPSAKTRHGSLLLASLLLIGLAGFPVQAQDAEAASEKLSFDFIEQLLVPLKHKASDLRGDDTRTAESKIHRRGVYSKNFKKIDDDTYQVSFQQDTASEDTLLTERLLLTLKRQGGDNWVIADEEVVDTYELYREHGFRNYPFDTFKFDKGGFRMTASKGYMVESYFAGEVTGVIVISNDLAYKYSPPSYKDYDKLYEIALGDHKDVLVFKPELFEFSCDPQTCEEIIASNFTGLERPAPADAGPMLEGPDDIPDWVSSELRSQYVDEYKDRMDQRRENHFAHFQRRTEKGNRWFVAWAEKSDRHGVGLRYDNWEGFEYQYIVFQNVPGSSFFQPIFGYYTEETLASTSARDLEDREDQESRWYDLYKVKGQVEVALEDDEIVHGDITFGLNMKEATSEIPFYLANIQRGDSDDYKNQTLFVNSIQYKGEDVTCVRTGQSSYLVVLPEEAQAGSKIELRLDFASRVIYKVNHAFSAMSRQGWLPFVRFGDSIDEFDMVVKSPSKYDVLGVGRKVSSDVDGEVLVTHWIADSPVTFPTIIFGKYRSDKPKFNAEKADGTVIPIEVHVDEASFTDWGIRPDALRPIAEQAANSINLYRELSGVDYPYGELNLVVDPQGGMYGQSPSSIVYLGAPVFRSASLTATYSADAQGTSRFTKSVVAHEVAHQWWGARVAHANYRNYWFVESLAEFFSAIYLENVYGRADYDKQVEDWRKTILDTDIRASVQDSTTLWPGEFPGAARQASIYNKGPFAFHMLRETFGDEKFFPAFKEMIIELTEMGEVTTEDIRMVAEKSFGGVGPDGNPYNVDLSWFFDQWIRGAGIPQYSFNYQVRRTEDRNWIVEGTVKQQVVVGNKSNFRVVDDTYYRGVVQITVTGKDKQDYPVRFAVQGAETPFAFKVPAEPREVVLNKDNTILAYDVLVNRDF